MTDSSEPLLAVDGTPLKRKLAQSLFRSRARAFGLALPLLAFIIVVFVYPILDFLGRSVYDARFATLMPMTTEAMVDWDGSTEPTEGMAAALVADLIVAKKEKTIGKVATRVNRELSGTRSLFTKTARSAKKLKPPYMEALANSDKDWADVETWKAMKTASRTYTPAYIAAALDRKMLADGPEFQPEDRQILIKLFERTLIMSLMITVACIALGYPVAWLLANLPMRQANLLMILVLLPFWTSLLVRTSAWKVMLQQQGVINDLLVALGMIEETGRLVMINNQFGTIVAMTHILLPFMILPMYSVMQTIPPTYLRAAKSLGATNWTAFWRVYFPQSVPGIGAGSILVFILAIGYYITPEIVGGNKGVFISNRIAYHIFQSMNWGLAAALGTILLVAVLILYWAYDKIVGIDNVKLGG